MSRPARLVTCIDCGRTTPVHAKERCAACYQRSRAVLSTCQACGEHKLTRAGVCLRCKRRRRAVGGTCTGCGREVDRLWSGRRCAACAHSSWSVGSCEECGAWAASIAEGRCRACRDFARRNHEGQCRSCRRHLPVNRHRRCRLCSATRRDAHLAGDPDWAVEPATRGGIQLFVGDLSAPPRRPSPSGGDHAVPADPTRSEPGQVDGQLELFPAAPDLRRADAAALAWAVSPDGADMQAAVAGFADAHGWRAATTRAVQRAVALLAVTDPCLRPRPATLAELRRRRLPVTRVHAFLTAHGLASPGGAAPAANIERVLAGLPAPMTRELTTWAQALTGSVGRGRPHAPSTIAAYLRAVAPAVRHWGEGYASLRQVSVDDVTAQLEPLHGSGRTITAVALRSLFSTLKAHRLVFADPTRSIRPGRFPRRPVLGLDEATRAGLLSQITRADHRLVVLLAAVHALTRADIAALRVDQVDLDARTVVVRGRKRPLDELTHRHLVTWLRERHRRWPGTANPHVLVSPRSAYGVDAAVSTGYFRALPTTVSQLRADRLLAEARDTGGDPLTLMHLFGVSDDTAVRYCAELDLFDQQHPDHKAAEHRG